MSETQSIDSIFCSAIEIESPEERKGTGKNSIGKVELRAFHQSGNIVIEIADDGKGLSREKILKKAIEKAFPAESED